MTEQTTQLVSTHKMQTAEPMSLGDIRANTALIKQALKSLMVKGVDYGTVPGCGDKLGLFKPGAEKLMFLFKLGCFPDPKRIHLTEEPDEISFIVNTKMVHIPTGLELGFGLGSASSNEEKYKWREATKKEWEQTDELRRRVKYKKGYYDKAKKKYGPEIEVLQVRTNPSDLNNTLLKMACKRSKVDGVITVTGASDIFTQDVEHDEDLPTIQQEAPLKKPEAKGTKPEKSEKGVNIITAIDNGKCSWCETPFKVGANIAVRGAEAGHPECA